MTSFALPILGNAEDGEREVVFEGPETSAPAQVEEISPPARDWQICHDPVGLRQIITTNGHQANRLLDQNLTLETASTVRWEIQEDDPLSASNIVENSWQARRDEWDVRVVTRSTLTADVDHFHLTTLVEAFESGRRVRAKTHSAAIPRDNL